jgi:hypothetical protein
LSIIASTVPDAPSDVQTVRVDDAVRISWTANTDNYAAVTAWEVSIQDATAAWVVESTYCVGDSTEVLTYLYCDVPVTALRDGPFNL